MIENSTTETSEQATCKNCLHETSGKYCSNCGQPTNVHRINYSHLWHEIQHGVFHIDKGLLYTTKELFIRPGHTIKEYLDGKRVKHFKPFAYVLILCTIYAVLAHWFHVNTFMEEVSDGINKANSQTHIQINGKEFLEKGKAIIDWFKEHYAYTILMLLPFTAFATFLSFRKNRYNYLEHLILNAYIAGQRTVVFIFFLPILYFLKGHSTISTIQDIETWIWFGLMTWTYVQFFDTNSFFRNIWLTIKAYFFILIQSIILLIAVVLLIVRFYQ